MQSYYEICMQKCGQIKVKSITDISLICTKKQEGDMQNGIVANKE